MAGRRQGRADDSSLCLALYKQEQLPSEGAGSVDRRPPQLPGEALGLSVFPLMEEVGNLVIIHKKTQASGNHIWKSH